MPQCKGIITKGKDKGSPCQHTVLEGQEYCWQHRRQCPLTPEEQAHLADAGNLLDRIEAELAKRVPPGIAGSYVNVLRESVKIRPHWAKELAADFHKSAADVQKRVLDLVTQLECDWNGSNLPTQGRSGERLLAKPAESLRAAMSLANKDAFLMFQHPRLWQEDTNDSAVSAKHGETELRIECELGFGPERAIQQIAQYGPAIAQAFLSMAGFWAERNAGKPRDTYQEVAASDLLRYMGRKEKANGGYANDDIMAMGRHIYLLKRVTVPKTRREIYRSSKTIRESISLGNLFMVDELELQRTLDFDGNELQSAVRVRYHMGAEMHEWLCGDHPQYALVSGKLLRYHPEREKYHILLGFCLAYYDKVNRQKNPASKRKISLPALLLLANLEVPAKNTARFLEMISMAIDELNRHGVIPKARLELPENRDDYTARQLIAKGFIEFPPLRAVLIGDETRQIPA